MAASPWSADEGSSGQDAEEVELTAIASHLRGIDPVRARGARRTRHRLTCTVCGAGFVVAFVVLNLGLLLALPRRDAY